VTARAPSVAVEPATTGPVPATARLVRVFAVVPACDEAPRIAEVVRTMPPRVERIVLVDDGSRDETVARARAVADPRLLVVSHERRRGVGAAIESGYRRAFSEGADVVVVLAGDAQMWPGDLGAVLEPVLSGRVGYAKGNRLDHEAVRAMPLLRRVGGELLSRATSLVAGRPVRDSQCGYTALSRAAWRRIERVPMWSSYGYPNDLLVRLHRAGVATSDVPVRAVYGDKRGGMRVRHALLVPYVLVRAHVRSR
jgi:glycosyltransferase involved in cell wall biosynthesis